MSVERILLTNDDGIDTVGLRALYDALAADYEVVVVAPAADQSSVGRSLSNDVDVHEHELGYAVEGTPADCVIAGLGELVPDADAVVAGCNEGANLGAYVLGRSGTVSAAVEAAFFDVPAIAVSLYVPGGDDWWKRELSAGEFANAARATRYLVDHAVGAGVFDHADYLNVNAPIAGEPPVGESSAEVESDADGAKDESGADGTDGAGGADDGDTLGAAPMRITEPSRWYEMDAERNGSDEVVLHDRIWDRMRDGDIPDPVGTDRRAIVDGEVSVSPLTAPHTTERHEALDGLAETY